MEREELGPVELISSNYFDAVLAQKVNDFLERKLGSSLPVLRKLKREKYSLFGITKTQMQRLLPPSHFEQLNKFDFSEKMYLSETLFVFRYKKVTQLEFAISYHKNSVMVIHKTRTA